MSLKPREIRKELQHLLENDRDTRKTSSEFVTARTKSLPDERGPLRLQQINLMQAQRPTMNQKNANKSPLNSFRKLTPRKEPSQIKNQLPTNNEKIELSSSRSRRYNSREIIPETTREPLIGSKMLDNAKKTKVLLSQAEKSISMNKLILLPKRPQKNANVGVGSNLLCDKGKISQIKGILGVYSPNQRPQSKTMSRPASVQRKNRTPECTPLSNVTPRIETNPTPTNDHPNRNMSSLLTNKRHYKLVGPHTTDTKNKLPNTPASKGIPIQKLQNSPGREGPSIQVSKSPVGKTFPPKTVVQKETTKVSFSAFRPMNLARNLAREYDQLSHTENHSSLTDPETSMIKSTKEAESVRKSLLPDQSEDYSKDELECRSSRKLQKTGRIRRTISSAQPSARDRSGLARSQHFANNSFEDAKPAGGLTHHTRSYKKFVALMNDIDMSQQFKDVQKMLREGRKGSPPKKVSWNAPQ